LSAPVKRPRNQTKKFAEADVPHGVRRQDDSLATQPVDRWLLASALWPEPGQDDPWPALPEDSARATTESTQFLRNAERLRALDLEQRGGR
jgi:hypothetical protein